MSTLAAEIEHLQEQPGADTALAQCAVRGRQKCLNGILSVQADLLEAVIPFAVQYDGTILLFCVVLDVSEAGRWQIAQGKGEVRRTYLGPCGSSAVGVTQVMGIGLHADGPLKYYAEILKFHRLQK